MKKLEKPVLTFHEFSELLNDSDKTYNLDNDSDFLTVKSILLDFVREGKIRPTFHYKGMYSSKAENRGFGKKIEPICQDKVHGSLHIFANDLISLIEQQDSYLQVCEKQNIKDRIFDDWVRIPNNTAKSVIMRHAASLMNTIEEDTTYKRIILHDEKFIGFHDLRYPKVDINKIFKTSSLTEVEQEIQSLRNENQNLKEQLTTGESSQFSDKTQDPKLIAMMAILLADKSYSYRNGETPNKSAIEKEIHKLVDELGIDSEHTYGLRSPSKRISDCLNEYSEYFYTLKKQKAK